jgi:hypothetical protein
LPTGSDRRGRVVPLLVLFFLVALGAAWIFGNPPGAAPDEASHYVKAIGAGGGDLAGSPPTSDPTELSADEYEALGKLLRNRADLERVRRVGSGMAGRWQQRSAREFTVPAGLGFTAFGCDLTRPERSALCLESGRRSTTAETTRTFMGTYQPYLYVAPGLLMRAAHEPLAALRLGRVAIAVLSLALLVAAAFVLWDRSQGALSLSGWIVAASPSVLFFATTLSTSGPETCAAICFTAALIRLTREPPQPSWVWPLAGGAGAVLALSRSLGPLFVPLLVAGAVVLSEPRRVRDAGRAGRGMAALAAALVVAGIAAGLAWQVAYQPSVGWDGDRIREAIIPSAGALDELAKQVVGKFGALETDLPAGLYVVWWLMFAVLVAFALAAAGRRERLALVGVSLGVVVATVVLSAVYAQTDFPLQGRHVLPLVVIVPLWAGEVVNRHPGRLSARTAARLVGGLAVAAAVVHALAWFANGRRFAVGVDGDWSFVGDADWEPPLGWLPWIAIVVLGTAAYLVAGAAAARSAARATRRPT